MEENKKTENSVQYVFPFALFPCFCAIDLFFIVHVLRLTMTNNIGNKLMRRYIANSNIFRLVASASNSIFDLILGNNIFLQEALVVARSYGLLPLIKTYDAQRCETHIFFKYRSICLQRAFNTQYTRLSDVYVSLA